MQPGSARPWNQRQSTQPYGGWSQEQPGNGVQTGGAQASLLEGPAQGSSRPLGHLQPGQGQGNRDGVLRTRPEGRRAKPNDQYLVENHPEEEEASGPGRDSQSDDNWGSWPGPDAWRRDPPDCASRDWWRDPPDCVSRDWRRDPAPPQTQTFDQQHFRPHRGRSRERRRRPGQGRPDRCPDQPSKPSRTRPDPERGGGSSRNRIAEARAQPRPLAQLKQRGSGGSEPPAARELQPPVETAERRAPANLEQAASAMSGYPVGTVAAVLGGCSRLTARMVKAAPDLVEAHGHATGQAGGQSSQAPLGRRGRAARERSAEQVPLSCHQVEPLAATPAPLGPTGLGLGPPGQPRGGAPAQREAGLPVADSASQAPTTPEQAGAEAIQSERPGEETHWRRKTPPPLVDPATLTRLPEPGLVPPSTHSPTAHPRIGTLPIPEPGVPR